MNDRPRFVSAEAIEPYRRAAEQAQNEAREKIAAAEKKADNAEGRHSRPLCPAPIRHDYRFQAPEKNPFHVTAIYHDGKFTYIEAAPRKHRPFMK